MSDIIMILALIGLGFFICLVGALGMARGSTDNWKHEHRARLCSKLKMDPNGKEYRVYWVEFIRPGDFASWEWVQKGSYFSTKSEAQEYMCETLELKNKFDKVEYE